MSKRLISRRNFIRLSLLGMIGVGFSFAKQRTSQYGLSNFIHWSLRGQIKRISPPSIVGLAKCISYEDDIVSNLRKIWNLSEMPEMKGKNILVKPNLVDKGKNNLASTNPKVVGAVIELLKDLGAAKIIVGDGSPFWRDTNILVKTSGLLTVLEALGVPFIDLNYDELTPIPTRDGWFRNVDRIWIPKTVNEVDYILSVPKLKTHFWTGVTLSIKNLLGTIPGSRYGWPKNIIHVNGITTIILGIYQSLPPVISVADGIIGMEGAGPLDGEPVQHGLLAIGKDPIAVDTICAELMGYSIDEILYLSGAEWAGIGQARRIETRGTPPEQLQQYYKKPPKLY